MDPRLRPAAVGLATGVLLLVLPEGLGPATVAVAALVAGWVLPGQPMAAALLFLLPTLALGAARTLGDTSRPGAGTLAFALILAVLFVAIFTHVGAGLAVRRQQD